MSFRFSIFALRLLCVLLASSVPLALPDCVQADSYTWQEGVFGNWNDASRWSGGPQGTVPGVGDTATINSGTVLLTNTVTIGTLNWGGGQIGDTSGNADIVALIVATAFNINGANSKYLGLNSQNGSFEIHNQGTATWTGTGSVGTSSISGATGHARFYNSSSCTFNIQNDAFWGAPFVNFGTTTKQSGMGNSTFSSDFDNFSLAKAQSGTLILGDGGLSMGSNTIFDCSAGAILQLSGTHSLGNAIFSGAGRIAIGGSGRSGKLLISEGHTTNVTGTLELKSGSIEGTGQLTVTGTFDWVGGFAKDTGIIAIETAGKLNINGNLNLDAGRILNNKGTATWNSGSANISGGATFNNKSGGKFNIQVSEPDGDATFGGSGSGVFNNEVGGVVTQTSTNTVRFMLPFNNHGTVNVQRSLLAFFYGGTSTGIFNTVTNAVTGFGVDHFNPKTYTHNSGTNFTGAGQVTNSGNVTVAPGATVNCDANYSVTDLGTLKTDLGSTFTAKNTFTLKGGRVDGSGTLNVSGKLTWYDGTMDGTGGQTNILAAGQMEVSSTGGSVSSSPRHILDKRSLRNDGVVTFQGNGTLGDILSMANGAVFTNAKTVNFQRDFYIGDNTQAEGERFDNEATGVINATLLGSDFLQGGSISVPFTNAGTVNVLSGTFGIYGGGSSSKAFNVAAGALLDFDVEPFIANTGTVFSGAGTTWVEGDFTIPTGNTVTIPAGHTFQLSGSLDGSGQLTVNGTLDWQAGVMKGGGITRVNAGATSTWSAGAFDQSKDLIDRTINNYGTIIWTGDQILAGGGAEINNESGANFVINTDQAMYVFNTADPQAVFTNKAGATLSKNGTTGTQLWHVPFTNAGAVHLQSGTLDFQIYNGTTDYTQTGGFTNLLSGTLASTQGANKGTIDIQGGTLTGTGTINAHLINNGRIKPGQSPGILGISGNYTQTELGKLDIEIGGPTVGTQYDQLQIGGAASLDGLLTVVHLNNFVPQLGSSFQVMTYASRSGSFSLSGTDYGELLLAPSYNATNLTLAPHPRTIGIDDAFVTEGTGGAVTAKFTVFLSDASSVPITVDFTTANGSATAPTDYVAASGTVTISPGLKSQTISVTVQGDALDEDDETFFVNLSNPSGAILEDNQGEGTIADNDAAPALSIRDLSVAEGAGGFTNAAFAVVLSAPSGKEVKVNYASINGSALAPGDYTAVSGTLVFAPGTTTRTISVPIKGDLLDEPNETFRINLNAPVNATITDNQALGTIRDDDPTPALTINSLTVTEGNTGTVNATFTVTLSAPSGQTVSVSAITSDGTARAPADYTATGIRLTFAPGQVSKVVNVPVKGDLLDETNETFFVILSSPGNAAIGAGRGTGTITDNDAPPSISIDDLSIGEGNAGQRIAALRLRLSAPSGQAVRVNAATANGTALAGTTSPGATGASDYVALAPTQLSFNVGSVFAYARVIINGDVLPEANETFLVNLSSPINATIADNQGIGTILNDDQAPSLSINDVSVAEGNAGTKTLTFTVTLSKPSAQTVSVKFASADGTARNTSDYVAQSGTLSFAPGSALTRTINIAINGDTVLENDETLAVLLSSAANASIGKARGVGTITNDDTSG
jgi:hypothetical protein